VVAFNLGTCAGRYMYRSVGPWLQFKIRHPHLGFGASILFVLFVFRLVRRVNRWPLISKRQTHGSRRRGVVGSLGATGVRDGAVRSFDVLSGYS